MTNVNQAEFEGKVAIVTGAASGIGRATTTLLNSRGASVVAEDIKPEVDQLASNNEHIATIVGDVSSEETAKRAVALAVERFGKVDMTFQANLDMKHGMPKIYEAMFSLKEKIDRIYIGIVVI